jgi:hypothetical protein
LLVKLTEHLVGLCPELAALLEGLREECDRFLGEAEVPVAESDLVEVEGERVFRLFVELQELGERLVVLGLPKELASLAEELGLGEVGFGDQLALKYWH